MKKRKLLDISLMRSGKHMPKSAGQFSVACGFLIHEDSKETLELFRVYPKWYIHTGALRRTEIATLSLPTTRASMARRFAFPGLEDYSKPHRYTQTLDDGYYELTEDWRWSFMRQRKMDAIKSALTFLKEVPVYENYAHFVNSFLSILLALLVAKYVF